MRGTRSFNRNVKSYQRDKPQQQATGQTFLIVTEGEKTEPHYLKALRDQLQLKSADVEIVYPKGTDPLSLAQRANALRETRKKKAKNGFSAEYDEVWVVFDLETVNHPHRKKAEQAQSSKEFSGIDFASTDPSFEYWLLLHEVYTTSNFADSAAVEKRFKSIHADYTKGSWKPTQAFLLKLPTAIIHAERCRQFHEESGGDGNPSTCVDKLARHLNKAANQRHRIINLNERQVENKPMRAKPTKGLCSFCGQPVAKVSANKHLSSCAKILEAIAKAEDSKRKRETLFHLRVQAEGQAQYWLDLEMRGSAKLKDLDHYLREIWLECCGHMSQFSYGGFGGVEIGMTKTVGQVFGDGETLTHIYDFGTESVTLIKPVRQREGKPLTTHPVMLLMRNVEPVFECQECQQPAAWLCMECIYEHDEMGTLCDQHAENHPHEEYGEPMRIVNSPRMGMCGYDGPAEPPY